MNRSILCVAFLSCAAPENPPAIMIQPIQPDSLPTAQPQATPAPRPYDLISVWGGSAEDIYVLGNGPDNAIFHSVDGGETWQKQALPSQDVSLWEVWGRSSKEVYLSGKQGRDRQINLTLQSTDGGASWREVQPKDGVFSQDLPDLYDLSWSPNKAIKGDPKHWPQANKGELWREKPSFLSLPYDSMSHTIQSVWGDGHGEIWVTGAPTTYHSKDAGRSWTIKESGYAFSLWGNSASELYSLQEGIVARSLDRGVTWQEAPLGVHANEIWGSGEATYIVGEEGTILQSKDKGASWQRLESQTKSALISVWGSDANNIFAVGAGETIIHSADQGRSWQERSLVAHQKPSKEIQQGVSLGIYYEKPGRTYEPMIDEIAALGADHIELLVHIWQMGQAANDVYQWPKLTISDKRLAEVIGYAQKKGLKVFLYPLLNIAGHGGWRGTITPKDWKKWWSSYQKIILHYATIAEATGVTLFSIGSEMSSAESHSEQWVTLIQETRKVFSGEIVYAANWDRYASLSFDEHLDYVGIDAYFPLTNKNNPSYEELLASWTRYKGEIISWQKKSGKPFLITELGYRSRDGANQHPWDYGASGAIDLEEQLLCYRAFRAAWQDEPLMRGVYLWAWSSGGKQDKGYSPRGKPAEAEIKDWFSL
jgi:photosystem II stability/assembly factor-like uncharacterized protein